MNWFFRALGRYGEFSGRSRRKEYWWFVIISWLLEVILIIPHWAVTVRRLHDSGKYGPDPISTNV